MSLPLPRVPVRALGALVLLGLLGGCQAISTLNDASRSLDSFDLAAAAVPPGPEARSRRVLLVALPTATGAVATDRIIVKPNPLQVAYLPDSRWIDPAPQHVQSLLIRSIGNSGGVGFVGGDAAGPVPDFVLLSDLQTFDAEIGPDGKPRQVTVRLNLTLVRDFDRALVASRRFEATVPLASTEPLSVAAAFNSAMAAILRDATRWTVAGMGGRVG